MSKLKISGDLSLPLDAATQTFAFIARKGAGKTYAAGKLVELLMTAAVQVIVLDTVGNWYGLRIDADGKGNGFDIPVFGGLRGDLPLEAHAGELVADVAVDTGRSLILDVSQFSLSDRKRFATAFGERLWRRKKGESHPSPLMLVIEESQLIVPQFTGKGGGDEARMLGIYEEIIRLGRNYGIGCTMISQRPQSVNKEVLNQTECLFVGQVNGSQEREALRKWITHQGMDVALVDELPALPVGTMYVWSPQWLQLLEKVKIAPKTTFDASATPKVGQRQTRRDPAPLDLAEIQQKMAAVVERAKADDPRHLRSELAKVKAELAKAQQAKTSVPARVEKREVFVLKDGQLSRAENLLDKLTVILAKGNELAKQVQPFITEIGAAVRKAGQPVAPVPPPMPAARPVMTAPPRSHGEPTSTGNGEVGKGGLRRIMIALAQRPGLTNRQIGVRAGLSSKSGSFGTYMSSARKNGWIVDNGDQRSLTSEGLAALGEYEPLPTGNALLRHWLAEMGDGGASRILSALATVYPEAMNNEEIGAAADISHTSGSFGTYMSRLRKLELIQTTKGLSKASDELFD